MKTTNKLALTALVGTAAYLGYKAYELFKEGATSFGPHIRAYHISPLSWEELLQETEDEMGTPFEDFLNESLEDSEEETEEEDVQEETTEDTEEENTKQEGE